ncbi:MAG: glycine betaine/L-proline ABC transporter substrate-binding protein ProX [Desulfobacterales bacterium]|nr:glycine betaine/L-proline ABC transporter substrate-binding protein ProX [Desulfobacterales bacterium]
MKSYLSLVGVICLAFFTAMGARDQTAAELPDDSEKPALNGATAPPKNIDPAGEEKPVLMARADWDTGWFQAEIFKLLLERLGYSVTGPLTMTPGSFYLSAARGDVDLWVNGWFPNIYFDDSWVRSKIKAVGYEVKAGALQGYLIDKKTADARGITNLNDLKDPEVARLFDQDGDGKADLVGCNIGWTCGAIIDHHLTAYGLRETVAQIQAEYSPLITDAISRFKQGRPILIYTWTPHWTTGALEPGKDVIWLEVPFSSLPEGQKRLESRTMVKGVPGCGSDPCNMGFPPSDIRVVANTRFLIRNPPVRRLAERVEIPLGDIEAQNARMIEGEDDNEDIRRHAREWLHKNRVAADRWLKAANSGEIPGKRAPPAKTVVRVIKKGKALRVATKRLEPFVIYRNGRYTGFSIELWDKIADEMGVNYELYSVDTTAKLLDEVKRGAADMAISGIGVTSRRERELDFSHPYFESGLQIMVARESDAPLETIFIKFFSILLSPGLRYGGGIFLVGLLIAAHIIWLLERRRNPDFSKGYFSGLWAAVWWAVVTVTTVGYGDKTPKGRMGRLFGMIWILAGYFVFAYFTASVTTTIALQELRGEIDGPEDLFGKKVATVEKSPAADYLTRQGVDFFQFEEIEDVLHSLETGVADAVVYDAPVLQHYATQEGRGHVEVVGLIFQEQSYGIALQVNGPHRETINVALLKLVEEGVYKEIHDRWFGP